MATRKSMREAEELVRELQSRYPDASFRIVDNSKPMRIGRKVAEMKGFKVIKDVGGIMVTAKVTVFKIVEIRQCRCGTEVLTIAIGEWSLNECPDCRSKRQARQERESREYQEIQAQKMAEADWRDRWEEE